MGRGREGRRGEGGREGGEREGGEGEGGGEGGRERYLHTLKASYTYTTATWSMQALEIASTTSYKFAILSLLL